MKVTSTYAQAHAFLFAPSLSRKVYCGMAALFCTAFCTIDLLPHEPPSITEDRIFDATSRFTQSFPSDSLTLVFFAAAIVPFLLFVRVRVGKTLRASTVVVAAFFSFAMVVGHAFVLNSDIRFLFDGGVQKLKTICSGIAWFIVGLYGITALFLAVEHSISTAYAIRPSSESNASLKGLAGLVGRVEFLFSNHPFALPVAVLALVWLPTYIGYLPGMFNGDTAMHLAMWYNQPTGQSNLIIRPNQDIWLTAHHPVVYTAILGSFAKAAEYLYGDVNVGLGCFTLMQFALWVLAVSYAISTLHKLSVHRRVIFLVFAFVAFCPIFPTAMTTITKDYLFAPFFCLLSVQQLRFFFLDDTSLRGRLVFVIALFGTTFLRNGAILFALGACAVVFVGCKSQRRLVSGAGVVLLAAYCIFTYMVLPWAQIAQPSQREILSIPFQQTARTALYHADDFTDQEKEAIDAILPFEKLAEAYNPELSDPVKNKYNKNATKEQMSAYWDAWAQIGKRHPLCYVTATANNYYSYFYANDYRVRTDVLWTLHWMDDKYAQRFNLHFADGSVVQALRYTSNAYNALLRNAPVIRFLSSPVFFSWTLVLLTVFLLQQKAFRRLALLIPLWLIFLVCFIGPISASGCYIRYLIPVALSLPFLVPACLLCQRGGG